MRACNEWTGITYRPIAYRLLLATLLCLPLQPAVAASTIADSAISESATAESTMADDRFVVTLHAPGVSKSTVSPSGRMAYLPMSPAERRRIFVRQAREVAAEFDLVVEEEWPIPALDVNCVVFRLQDPARRYQVMQALARRADVDAVQSLNFFRAEGDATGIRATAGHATADLATTGEKTGDGILQQLAHRASGRNVSIAVIDTGADLAHRNLQNTYILARDMVDGSATGHDGLPAETHGTAIIGLLLASGDNAVGVRGYVPDADVRLLRACWEETDTDRPARCNTFTLAKALSDVIESPVDIVNLSISGPSDPLLERLGRVLISEQVVLVAGGESRNGFPGSVTGSLLAADISIRSGNTMILLPGDRFGLRKGSSIDAARVTALTAMLKEMDPGMSAENVMAYLDNFSRNQATTSSSTGIIPRQ